MKIKGNIDQQYVIQSREKYGQKIKALRQQADMSVYELAFAVGLSTRSIEKLEDGEYPFSIDVFIKICIVLDCSITFDR